MDGIEKLRTKEIKQSTVKHLNTYITYLKGQCVSEQSHLTSLCNYTNRIVSVDIREVIMIHSREENR